MITMLIHSKRNIPLLILPSFKNLASAVGQKTQQRPTRIAYFFYNHKWKTNKGRKGYDLDF